MKTLTFIADDKAAAINGGTGGNNGNNGNGGPKGGNKTTIKQRSIVRGGSVAFVNQSANSSGATMHVGPVTIG